MRLARSITVLGVTLATTAAAASRVPRIPGAGVSVAVARGSGKLAVCRAGKLEIFDSPSAESPSSRFDVPDGVVTLLEFRGDTVSYAFTDPGTRSQANLAVRTDGRELLPWPNEGISAEFPTAAARLTLDGKGVYQVLRLTPAARAFFGFARDIPDGATVVATYRFVGEKVLARAAADFADAVGLAPDDFLIVTTTGGALRHKSPTGVVWRKDELVKGPVRLLDVDAAEGLALLQGSDGTLAVIELSKGDVRWRLEPAAVTKAVESAVPVSAATDIADARLLQLGRLLLFGAKPQPWLAVLDPQSRTIQGGDLLAGLETAGLGAVRSFWMARNQDLSRVWQLPPGAGGGLLLEGPDGWYEVGLP